MPTFAYTARSSSGQAASGTLAAGSMQEALQQLRAEGKYPISLRPAEAGAAIPAADRSAGADIKVPRADVIQIATQLAVMLETGVTLVEGLDCIGAQSERPAARRLVRDVREQLEGGMSFSDALGRHPRSFPRIFVALMKAAEKSGMMAKLLNRAVAYMTDERDTVRRVKGALTYPGIMLGFAITTTIFLLAFVLPRFTAIYANKKAALPLPTKILMGMSDFLVENWPAVVIGTGVSIVAGYFFFRSGPGARAWHYMQLRVPLLGPMFRKLHLSRGLRMVGTMASAGVTLTDCITTAHDLCANSFYRDLWTRASERIQTGKQLSEPLFASALVPRSVSQMIFSGEKSGKLGFVMEQVAAYSEAELKEQIANLTRYIEPLMIMVMGLIIGGVAMALLLPIFTISKVMSAG